MIAFTILNQDMIGGLEILNKNGIYIPAKPIRGTFVVNVGDFLQRISNDQFVSTVHRVRNSSGVNRYSIPFFFSFNMDVAVPVRDMVHFWSAVSTGLTIIPKVMPACTSEDNPAKYEPRNLHEVCIFPFLVRITFPNVFTNTTCKLSTLRRDVDSRWKHTRKAFTTHLAEHPQHTTL